jgi:hypothetical protein
MPTDRPDNTSYALPYGGSGGPVIVQQRNGYGVAGMLSSGLGDAPLLHVTPAHVIRAFLDQYERHGAVRRRRGCF